MTGLTFQAGHPKVLQLLKDALPEVTRMVFLYHPASLSGEASGATLELMHSAAQAQNVVLQPRGRA